MHHLPKLLLLTLLAITAGCRDTETSFSSVGETMGTTYNIKCNGVDVSLPRKLLPQINQALDDVDHRMSTYREDSEISRFNAYEKTDWFPVSKETARVVEEALKISRRTGGAFDPTVGPLVRLWNFGPGRRDKDQKPSDEAIRQAMAVIGYQKLEVRLDPPALRKTDPHVELDLSGIAKGYAVDRVAETLDAAGVKNYMVEVGGEVRTHGVNTSGAPWQIAIEKPDAKGRSVQQVVELADQAMATSGDYRNYFEKDGVRYSHLIDPTTGRPIRHRLASVSVRTPTCMEADALATGLIVMGPEKAKELAEKEHLNLVLLTRSGTGFLEERVPTKDAPPKETTP